MADSWAGRRSDWVDLADDLVEGALARMKPSGVEFDFGGVVSDNGARSDALEGVARVFQIYSFAVASGSSRLGLDARDVFVRALDVGTLPVDGITPWPAPGEPGNGTVNAAIIALGLRIIGPDFWAALSSDAQERLVAWMDQHVFLDTIDNNLILFRLAHRSFLASIGRSGPEHDAACAAALARLEHWYDEASGWYSDGPTASYDYYNAFELHFLPPLLAHLDAWDAKLADRYRERLDRFATSLESLIAPGGSPVYFGRSLVYRFGIAAPFPLTALIGGAYPAPRAGERARAMVAHFLERGAVSDGLLALGWYGPQEGLAQGYGAPGAAYLAGKAFVALLLPEEHPFWAGASRPDPIVDPRPLGGRTGLLLDADPDGELVRLTNHGTNERRYVLQNRFDDPVYSRLGYSTMTAPVEADDQRVLDRSIVVVGKGEPSSRGPIEPVATGRDWASSRSHPRRRSTTDGSPNAPFVVRGRELSRITMHALTVIRRGWHVDVCVIPPPQPTIEYVTAGGWAIADGEVIEEGQGPRPRVLLRSATLESEIVGLYGYTHASSIDTTTPQPFGAVATIPFLRVAQPRVIEERIVLVAASRLTRPGVPRSAPPRVVVWLSDLLDWRHIIIRFGWRFAVVRLRDDGLHLSG